MRTLLQSRDDSYRFPDDLEKCLSLFPQRAVARVNDVKASAQRFGVEKFNRHKFSRPKFLAYGQLRKEGHAQAAIHHALGGFDGVDFQSYVWNQAGAAEKTVGEGPVARSALVENQRPACHLLQARAASAGWALLGMS